eukprot:NODE_925_length_2243_cov_52.552358_g790_i0.p1 GENE.NODE_925_length_2243_cov_52.552358_g790_i0~~NODE_925_length_2243_cov_52.552358_g790_i0.p1  ORF type:complete len:711 (+),score=144.72 NODE_925_length_2243_cov_52.552358_g790_i0:89-2221(+)
MSYELNRPSYNDPSRYALAGSSNPTKTNSALAQLQQYVRSNVVQPTTTTGNGAASPTTQNSSLYGFIKTKLYQTPPTPTTTETTETKKKPLPDQTSNSHAYMNLKSYLQTSWEDYYNFDYVEQTTEAEDMGHSSTNTYLNTPQVVIPDTHCTSPKEEKGRLVQPSPPFKSYTTTDSISTPIKTSLKSIPIPSSLSITTSSPKTSSSTTPTQKSISSSGNFSTESNGTGPSHYLAKYGFAAFGETTSPSLKLNKKHGPRAPPPLHTISADNWSPYSDPALPPSPPYVPPQDNEEPNSKKRKTEVTIPGYDGYDSSDDEDNIPTQNVIPCYVCRQQKEPDIGIICDGCMASFHIDCLTPPLESIPEGEWRCPTCIETQTPIFIRDPYVFLYPESRKRYRNISVNISDAPLLYRVMKWLIKYRSAGNSWVVLRPFIFHCKNDPNIVDELISHLRNPLSRQRFSRADRVALLLEYAPEAEDGGWGHKMLVVFNKKCNRVELFDSLGSYALNPDTEDGRKVYTASYYMSRHLGEALLKMNQKRDNKFIGISNVLVDYVIHRGRLQHKLEYLCQSWALLIFDALISGTAKSEDFLKLSTQNGFAYEPRFVPGTIIREPVVFRTPSQFVALFHTYHLRRLLYTRARRCDEVTPFGMPWGKVRRQRYRKVLGAGHELINQAYIRRFPWIGEDPFPEDSQNIEWDPLKALKGLIASQIK